MAGSKQVELAHMESRKPISKEGRHKMFMEEGESTHNQAHYQTTKSKIQKVPSLLRDNENFDKYYKPRVISFGPIHHGKQKFKPTEKYKLRLAYKFVQESGMGLKSLHGSVEVKEKMNELHRKVEEKINELQECFEKEVIKDFNNEDLAWMFFVDGCAILQFIHSFSNTFTTTYAYRENQFKKLGIKNHSVVFGQQDLFLLENQLPYCLLEWLMSWSNNKTVLEKSIDDFIDMYIKHPQPFLEQDKKKGKGSTDSPQSQTEDHVTIDMERSESIQSRNSQPTHLLDLLRGKLLQKTKPDDTHQQRGANGQQLHSFGNVQELRAAGIHMKPSGSSSLRDITFDKRFNFYPGHLMLPPIIVDDSTAPKFLNLIAYEMCSDFENDYSVTSYISFLDSLIDQPNDVRELRKAGILQNFLDSDEEVAKLFNEIGTDLVPDPDTYSDVKHNIQQFCNVNCMSRIVLRFHEYVSLPEYFNSRTLWAVIGALLGLGLSLAQVIVAALTLPGHDSCKCS